MTVSLIFCASIAQASPVGPAPMTSTSVRISGRGLALVLARVSSSTAARKSGMGLTAESVEATGVRTQLGNEILACRIAREVCQAFDLADTAIEVGAPSFAALSRRVGGRLIAP